MRYLEAKALGGAPQNKALSGPPENKAAEPTTAETGLLDSVSFASPQAKTAAEEAGLSAESFKRKRHSSEKGFTVTDVERIAATVGTTEDEEPTT